MPSDPLLHAKFFVCLLTARFRGQLKILRHKEHSVGHPESQAHKMEHKNLIGMLAGYYLSRFDKDAYRRFPGDSQSAVHKYLAEQIGVRVSSVKLWRDEFDPIHANSRQGWHKR